MKVLPVIGVALAACVISGPAASAPSMQPPMNTFDEAFYACDNGGAFLISYDSSEPANATMTTSNNNKQYALKRTQADNGVQFVGDTVKFWTDGKAVVVDGADEHLLHCKMKAG